MVIAANVLLAIAAVAHVHAAVAATLVSYQVIRKRRRRGKQQRRSAAWSLMHEQLRAPTDEDEDPYEYMDDWAFRRYHRLSREAFDHLLELISSDLEPVSRRGARGHLASPIGARTQLSVALRILVGGSYLDVSHSHRVSRPTCFTIVDRVVDAINSCEELDLPLVRALDACEAGESSMLDEITALMMCGSQFLDGVRGDKAGIRKVNVFRMCAVQKSPQPVQTGRGCSSSPVFILYIQIELSQPRDGKNGPDRCM